MLKELWFYTLKLTKKKKKIRIWKYILNYWQLRVYSCGILKNKTDILCIDFHRKFFYLYKILFKIVIQSFIMEIQDVPDSEVVFEYNCRDFDFFYFPFSVCSIEAVTTK